MKYLIFPFTYSGVEAMSYATHHVMPTPFGGKWGTDCFNTRFPLLTLLCAVCIQRDTKKNTYYINLNYYN